MLLTFNFYHFVYTIYVKEKVRNRHHDFNVAINVKKRLRNKIFFELFFENVDITALLFFSQSFSCKVTLNCIYGGDERYELLINYPSTLTECHFSYTRLCKEQKKGIIFMIELEKETESKVVFDIDEEYGITIRRSAFENLWADEEGNIYRLTKKGGIFAPKTWINNAGYEITNTHKPDGKSTTVPVHRIVATAWVKRPNTDKKMVVDHINDNKLDNRASNLRWVTYHDNLVKHHRMTTMYGELSYSNGRAVVKISEGGQKVYKSLSAAARDNQMSVTSVQGSANHTLHLDRPYYFEFAQEAK